MAADFQLISSDARKRTKDVHPYMQFYFVKKTKKNVLWLGVKIPSALFTTTMAYDNLKETDVYNSGAEPVAELWKGL